MLHVLYNLGLYTAMHIAELATDLIVDGQVILPEGKRLTALDAHERWEVHKQDMEFRCLSCHLPLQGVNVYTPQTQWKRSPYFRSHPDQKGAHHAPCPFAGEGEQKGELTGESEVTADKSKIPTRLVKWSKESLDAPVTVYDPHSPAFQDPKTSRHEESTSEVVLDFINVYFEKIRGCRDPRDQRIALQGLDLFLISSRRNVGYANAFWYVSKPFPRSDYRIFYGYAKEVVKCSDGYIISYRIPGKCPTHKDLWKAVVAYLPRDVLDEFDWGRHIERTLTWNEINKAPWVFLCGRPNPTDRGIVIPLESVYWLHCAQHPCWSNKGRVRVWEVLQPSWEVLPILFARRLGEFQQKFSLGGTAENGGITHVGDVLQQEPSISQPDLPQSYPSTETVSSSALQQESSEQRSMSLDIPRSLSIPEPESPQNAKRWGWGKKVIDCLTRLWKKL